MPKKKKENKKTPSTTWKTRFETAMDVQTPLFEKFAKYFDIKYAVYNTDNMAPWRSKVYIPILSNKADDIIAKLYGMKPGFEVAVRDEFPETAEEAQDIDIRREKAREKVSFDYDNPMLEVPIRDKVQDGLTDAAVCGVSVSKVPWRVTKKVFKARPVLDDGVNVNMNEYLEKTIEYGYNDIESVNIFNFFIDPNAKSLQTAEWIIIRDYVTLKHLKDRNADGVERYKNLDKLEDAKAEMDQFQTFNQSRNRLLNLQDDNIDDTVDRVEIYECYEKDTNKIITFANVGDTDGTWIELQNRTNPYWHGKYPLVSWYVKRKPHQFWGESLFETSERLQSAVNDIFNHYMDNWNLSIDGMIMREENSVIDDFIVEPGGELTYRGQEKPSQFRFPEPNPQQLSMIMDVLEKAIEESTISQFSSGVPDSSMDKTAGTATGIIRLQEAANDRIGYLKANFRKTLRELGQMWLFNNQQFMSMPATVTSSSGKELTITPADLQGILELKILEAEMEPISKEQQKVNHLEWVQHMLQLQQAALQQAQLTGGKDVPVLKFADIAQESSRVFGKENSSRFVGGPQ